MGDGAVLLQEERNGAGPAEYYFKKIKHHQKTFSIHRGQAIVSPVQHFEAFITFSVSQVLSQVSMTASF